MDLAGFGQTLFMTIYTILLVVVSIYGLHRWGLVVLYYLHRRKTPRIRRPFAQLPVVTIQLPMYNEPYVAKRIIEKTCRIDYPRDRLQIQILDDSTDETPQIARQAVEQARLEGFDIEYIHRTDRTGYKAGALENGLKTARGEFVAIFDADFLPEEDFLLRSIHYFSDPKVCAVQTRWEHLNRNHSLLTRSQALFLDGHFAIEHVARNRSRRFMAFNGTAGTWRRSAIADAGGWQHDTLTEDLDLSIRAQMRGWRFVFLPELTSPAELPPEMNAFKAQQFRWTKGGAQTTVKLLPRLLLSKLPLKVKLEGFFQLTTFCVHIFMLGLVLLMFPALYLRTCPLDEGTVWRSIFDISVFTLATLSASVYYTAAQVELTGDWRSAVKYLPVMMALGVGLSVSNTRAILEGWMGRKSEFVRTPKYGSGGRMPGVQTPSGPRRKRSWMPLVEFALGIYMSFCVVMSLLSIHGVHVTLTTPFMVLFAFGFFYVSLSSMLSERQLAATPAPAAPQTVAIPAAQGEETSAGR